MPLKETLQNLFNRNHNQETQLIDGEEIRAYLSVMLDVLLTVHEYQMKNPVAGRIRSYINEGKIALTVIDNVPKKLKDAIFMVAGTVNEQEQKALLIVMVNTSNLVENKGNISRRFGVFLGQLDEQIKALNLQGISLGEVPAEQVPQIVEQSLLRGGLI